MNTPLATNVVTSRKQDPQKRCFLSLIFVLLSLCSIPAAIGALPVVFNYTKSAAPGDVIGLQGSDFGSTPQVWIQRVSGNETSVSPQTQLPLESSYSSIYVSARIPNTLTMGLYAVWVKVGSILSNPVYINRANAWGANDLCGTEINPGQNLRLFGRNLSINGASPTVRFVSGANSFPATVNTATSGNNWLTITAPTGLSNGTTYQVLVKNGYGGSYGETSLDYTLTGRTVNNDPFGLGIPWGADFTFSANVYNVKTDPRLALRAAGNGVADDRAAIQSAIDTANGAGGGVIFFPSGTYLISSNTPLVLKSNVILMGAGMNSSQIKFQRGGSGLTTNGIVAFNCSKIGFIDIALYNTNTGGGYMSRLETNANVVLLRSKFSADSGKNMYWVNNTKIIAKDSVFNANQSLASTGTFGEVVYILGTTDLIFKNNTVTWYSLRVNLDNSSRSLIEGNHLTRAVQNPNQGAESGAISIANMHKLILIDNVIDRSGTGPLSYNNDGEAILCQGGGPLAFDFGTVTSATATSLSNSSKTWIDYSQPIPQQAGQGYYVSVIAGTGTGQIRKIIASTGTSLTVDKPWDVIPTGGSVYTISPFQMYQALIQNNQLFEHPLGLMLYNVSALDVSINANTLEDCGSIWLFTNNQPTTSSATINQTDIQVDVSITNNYVSNTLRWYPSFGSNARIFLQAGKNVPAFRGTQMYCPEIRRNEVVAPVPNQTSGENGEGLSALANANNLGVDDTTPAILGAIFQDNIARNTESAFHLTTGNYGAVLWNNQIANVGTYLLDVKLSGTTHPSTGTVLGAEVGLWRFNDRASLDTSGNDNHGALINGPAFSTDTPFPSSTYSLDLNGSNYVQVSEAFELDPIQEFTIAFWVKGVTAAQPAWARLVTKNPAPVTSPGWEIQRSGTGNGFSLRIDTNAGGNQARGAITGILDNTWHHIAYVVGGGSIKAYKDGSLVTSDTYSQGTGFSSSGTPIRFGADSVGGSLFKGKLDEIRFYATQLTSTDITTLYNTR